MYLVPTNLNLVASCVVKGLPSSSSTIGSALFMSSKKSEKGAQPRKRRKVMLVRKVNWSKKQQKGTKAKEVLPSVPLRLEGSLSSTCSPELRRKKKQATAHSVKAMAWPLRRQLGE